MLCYTCLQVLAKQPSEMESDRMIYAITAYMDSVGMISCRKESAERIIALTRTPAGWAVFDDCAGREGISCDGLGCGITRKLSAQAVRITRTKDSICVHLYTGGIKKACFKKSADSAAPLAFCQWLCGKSRAARWYASLAPYCSEQQLKQLFSRDIQSPDDCLVKLKEILKLDETANYGFASLDDSSKKDIIYLYFMPSNVVKQSWSLKRTMPMRAGMVSGFSLFRHKKTCKK